MVKTKNIILYSISLGFMTYVLILSQNIQPMYEYKDKCIIGNSELDLLAPGFFKIKNKEDMYLSIVDRKSISGFDILKIELAEYGLLKKRFYLVRGTKCLTMSF